MHPMKYCRNNMRGEGQDLLKYHEITLSQKLAEAVPVGIGTVRSLIQTSKLAHMCTHELQKLPCMYVALATKLKLQGIIMQLSSFEFFFAK